MKAIEKSKDSAAFVRPEWSWWRLLSNPEQTFPDNSELRVDNNVINETLSFDGVVATAKETFLGSVINVVVRLISNFVPDNDLRCSYVIQFQNMGKVELFMSNDVWSSKAQLTSDDPKDLPLMLNATKEYIRYRCFIDSIQPMEGHTEESQDLTTT